MREWPALAGHFGVHLHYRSRAVERLLGEKTKVQVPSTASCAWKNPFAAGDLLRKVFVGVAGANTCSSILERRHQATTKSGCIASFSNTLPQIDGGLRVQGKPYEVFSLQALVIGGPVK